MRKCRCMGRQRIIRRRVRCWRSTPDTDVLVCDDGLQHLALGRDIHCIFNAKAAAMAFSALAAPLREPWPRPWTGCFTRANPPHRRQLAVMRPAGAPALTSPPQPGRPCLQWRQTPRLLALAELGSALHAVAAPGQPCLFAMLANPADAGAPRSLGQITMILIAGRACPAS